MAFLPLLLVACGTQDEKYYRTHPQVLQEAIKRCSSKPLSPLSCDQLAEIAVGVNELAYQLQINPQAFGKKILSLQEALAKQQVDLNTQTNQPILRANIEKSKQQLAAYLAIIRWLESPESQ